MFLRLGTINIWPSQSTVSTHMPDSMRSKFPHVRVILDCAEFNAECPDSLVLHKMMYSEYKGHVTVSLPWQYIR